MRLPIPRSPLTGALSAIAVLSLGGAGLALHTSSGSAASASTRTVTVSKGVVQSTASGTGNLAAANQLDLSFGTSGTVEKLYVKEGEHVSQGQLIARLNSDSQKVALAEAKATLTSAEDAEATASDASASNADTATTTDAVLDSGTQVAMIDAADTTSTTPAATTPAAATTGATTTTPSTGTTGTTGTTGSSGTAQATPTPSASTTTRSGTTSGGSGSSTASGTTGGSSGGSASGGSSSGGSSSGGSSSGSSSTTSAASAAAQVASDKLAVKEAQAALDDTELRAPVAGTIVSLSGAVGDSVSAGSSSSSSSAASSSTTSAAGGTGAAATGTSTGSSSSSSFATLSQLSKLAMSVSFSESDIGKVKVGQAATVTVSAADDVKLAARVTKIGLVATTSNSVVSYPVELTITQNAAGVLAGMSASAEIVVEQATGVLNVPTQALSGKSVTVIKNGEKTTTPVTTGIAGTSTTQIVSGLSAGDVVALPTLSAASTTSSSSTTTGRTGAAAAAGGFGGGTGGGGFAGGAGGGGFGGGAPTR